MTLVAATTTFAADATDDRMVELHAWARTRKSIDEELHAIELVLTHEFDEPHSAPSTGFGREAAQRVREAYLLEASGLARGTDAGAPVAFLDIPRRIADDARLAA